MSDRDGFLSLWGFTLGAAGIGLIATILGVVLLSITMRRSRACARLLAGGKRVMAAVRSVDRDAMLAISGLQPFRIAAEWVDPATGGTRVFRSEPLTEDPTVDLAGGKVTFVVDPANHGRYCFERTP